MLLKRFIVWSLISFSSTLVCGVSVVQDAHTDCCSAEVTLNVSPSWQTPHWANKIMQQSQAPVYLAWTLTREECLDMPGCGCAVCVFSSSWVLKQPSGGCSFTQPLVAGCRTLCSPSRSCTHKQTG